MAAMNMTEKLKADRIGALEKTNQPFYFHSVSLPTEFDFSVFRSDEFTFLPGFCDVHVHFREPGFSYKETIVSGSRAAAHGGFTDVCTMPNLSPVPDSLEHLKAETDLLAPAQGAAVRVHPYGAITVGEKGETLADFAGLSDAVVAFSDDGKGVQRAEIMRDAMLEAKKYGKIIAAHCEVNDLLHGGCIHDGAYAAGHGLPGISSESEYFQIERDLALAKETGCAYHVCHISAKESVALIRRAKREGVDVTCETAPHYLVFCEDDLRDEGRWKMNPPLRTAADRAALIEGLLDGTIDMIATDHAPHAENEKSKGLLSSAFGVVGLETAFPALYTALVKKGVLTLEKLIDLMAFAPRRRFRIPENGFTVFRLADKTVVDPDAFFSKGHATPFAGMPLFGRCVMTVSDGRIAYLSEEYGKK